MITLTINGERREVDVPPDMPLLWGLRDVLSLTGTKFGGGIAQCGACTVHLAGKPVRSCLLSVGALGARAITPIAGLGVTPNGAKVQKAWLDLEVIQCGYCQSGQIMSAAALLDAIPHPDDADIDAAMAANICLRAYPAGDQKRIGGGVIAMRENSDHIISLASSSVPDELPSLSRRGFLKMSAATAFLFGFSVPLRAIRAAAEAATFAPNAFIRIDEQGEVTLIMPQVEMGQGTYTSISMILAEELDADWTLVRVEHAPADEKLYANPDLGFQGTGDSTSIRAFWKPLRLAGAATRACFIEAAAHSWGVSTAECRTENSKVMHDQSGRTLDYGALVSRAAAVTPPKAPPLKEASAFRLIGRSLKRLDTPDKVNGKATYAIDVVPPGVKFATNAASPVLGGTVAHVDDRRAKAIPGVRQIVVLDDLVAVVGDHMWAAKCGLAALDITWNDGPNAEVSSELIWSRLRSASLRDGAVANEVGDVKKALGSSGKASSEVVTAAFEMPLWAHACMEPLNCTVDVTPT